MDSLFIPQPDTIPVSWGWFQFLLLLTLPLHLLAMNAMIGGLALAVYQQIRGGEMRREFAHKIMIALPMGIAFVVNLGVAPLLFVQVLYGQFFYTSSILMGSWWLLVVPLLIVAYYGAYLYDFKFFALGRLGPVVGLMVLAIMLCIGFLFSSNMVLMALPEQFHLYFDYRNGSYLVQGEATMLPRYLHMMLGSLAVGSLLVALLMRVWRKRQPELVVMGDRLGLFVFFYTTIVNIVVGFWFFLSLQWEQMQIFLGGDLFATVAFFISLVITAGALFSAFRKKFWPTLLHALALVVVMTFLRAWLRAGFLSEVFNLGQLQVVAQYSPMLLFFGTLVLGLLTIGWLLLKATAACRS